MKTLQTLIFALALNFDLLAADTIPPELVGEWVEPNSKFSWGVLEKGGAVYLSSTGFAALFGAPPPIGKVGTATYDPKTLTLTLVLPDGKKKPLKMTIIHDLKAKTLTTVEEKDEVEKVTFTRRRKTIPKWIWEMSK